MRQMKTDRIKGGLNHGSEEELTTRVDWKALASL
jgi:hypothetical protein